MNMANTNKIKYTSGNTISDGAITNNNVSLGVDTAIDYGPTDITGFWQGVTPNNGGYTIYKLSSEEQPRIVVAQDDEALIFFANSFANRCIGEWTKPFNCSLSLVLFVNFVWFWI